MDGRSRNGANTVQEYSSHVDSWDDGPSRNKSAVREKIVDSLPSGDPVPKNSQHCRHFMYPPLAVPPFKRGGQESEQEFDPPGNRKLARFKRCCGGELVAMFRSMSSHARASILSRISPRRWNGMA